LSKRRKPPDISAPQVNHDSAGAKFTRNRAHPDRVTSYSEKVSQSPRHAQPHAVILAKDSDMPAICRLIRVRTGKPRRHINLEYRVYRVPAPPNGAYIRNRASFCKRAVLGKVECKVLLNRSSAVLTAESEAIFARW
jgi:hypothetical protein